MKYVFLNIETSGLNYEKDEIIYIDCLKYDKYFKQIERMSLHVHSNLKLSSDVERLTKVKTLSLRTGFSCKNVLQKLKSFIKGNTVIGINSKFDLSFLLTAMYKTKVDMKFWYFDLYQFLSNSFNKKILDIYKLYKIRRQHNILDYVNLMRAYLKNSEVSIEELVGKKPRSWNLFFRGIYYSEYLGNTENYSFYLANLSSHLYPNYLACLKEIRCEDFTFEELRSLKENYNIKILVHILEIDNTIIQLTHDYYIVSYYDDKIDLSKNYGKEYREKIIKAADFIENYEGEIEITCYESILEYEEKTSDIEKEYMDIIQSKVVREKKKWASWKPEEY